MCLEDDFILVCVSVGGWEVVWRFLWTLT